MATAPAATRSGDHFTGGRAVGRHSTCSTPFVSIPSSPARDPSFNAAAGCYFSVPSSPARGAGDCGRDYEFDFDFASNFPSPAVAAMSSADELFHNGQIRLMRLSSFLLRLQALSLHAALPACNPRPLLEAAAPANECNRFRSQSVHRRSRSLSPFRTHWMSSSSSSPAPAKKSVERRTSASRSSSSSSTASSMSSSSSSSRSYRRWRFLKDLVHRSKSNGSKRPPPLSPLPPLAAPKRNSSPAGSRDHTRRRSAHEQLYEARRAETEEIRQRTFLPYRQGLLLGCLGLGSRGYGAMHGLAAAATKSRA